MKPNLTKENPILIREDLHLGRSLNVVYLFAIATHLMFLYAFRQYNARFLEIVNYFSPFIYLGAIFFNLKGRFVLGTSLAIFEAVAHGVISVVYIGWSSNFHLYILLVYLSVYFLYKMSLQYRIIVSLAITISYVSLYVYSIYNEPIYDLPYAAISAAGILNIVITATVLSLFALTYSHYIHKNIGLLTEAENQQRTLNHQKDRFFSIFSHDLKNPVNSVYGFVDLLIERYDNIDDAKRKHYLSQIQSAISDTSKLVNNLLEWSKSQLNEVEVFPDEIKVEKAVYDIKSLLGHYASTKDISINVMLRNNPSLYVDEHMFRAVMRNLISNAIKFTETGGVIEVKAFTRKNLTKISVTDNGIGIPVNSIDDVFSINDKKIRVGTNNERGTGLGLVVVKEFIEKNNGNVTVKSKIGKGSTFTLLLPASKN